MSDSTADDLPEPIGGYASYDPAPPRVRRKHRKAVAAADETDAGGTTPENDNPPETATEDAPKQTRRRAPAKKS